jgi:hypothetical protein
MARTDVLAEDDGLGGRMAGDGVGVLDASTRRPAAYAFARSNSSRFGPSVRSSSTISRMRV